MVDSAKLTGAAIGAAAMGHDFLMPLDSEAVTGKFPESNCGVNHKNGRKILVAYATQCGSTAELQQTFIYVPHHYEKKNGKTGNSRG